MHSEIREFSPTSPGVRHRKAVKYNIDKQERSGVRKKLTKELRAKRGMGSGRNNGQISSRRRGGGAKRLIRTIDFKRMKDAIPAKVKSIEYDPNRNALIALICYADGYYSYIIAQKGVDVGDVLHNGPAAEIKNGNCLPLKNIPLGSIISCIEMKVGKGAQLIRSAGTSAMLAGIDGDYAIIRLKSGEVRKVHANCRAVIGEVSNGIFNLQSLGKAGASRHKGRRSTVRGTAMNPIDHPHGGGEGRSFGRHPVSPTGVPTKGKKTRKTKRNLDLIIRRRNVNRRSK